jgi:5-hydroxyisourate hydrolase
MAGITTHVLDTSRGKPGEGIAVTLEQRGPGGDYVQMAQGATDSDGRLRTLTTGPVESGVYRLTFGTSAYFESLGQSGFFPSVAICFEITNPAEHHHVPLLLSPFGYSTYRGS